MINMKPLEKRLEQLNDDFKAAYQRLQIDQQLTQLAQREKELEDPEIWHNPSAAQALSKKAASLRQATQPWQTLKTQIADIGELLALNDAELRPEVETQLTALENQLTDLKKQLLLTGPYDDHNAILRLTSGVGGLDAMDFTEMLERMYLRYAERVGYQAQLIERSPGETAGLKTSVLEISGPYAYGRLKGEHGVHRLVRLSPFNAESRETSFALVEVLPEIETPDEVKIDDKDLKIDVYRAGGHGGQSVNTTDSAVRITHLPTGIVVAIQNERSQLQNKEKALEILRSKLAQLQLEQQVDSTSKLRAGKSAEWGAQIRNYVLHPYKLVKDTRTKYQENDVEAVLGGKIDGFIEAYLENLTP